MVASFFERIKNFVFPEDEKNVLILGYTTAGKTTLIEQLLQRKILNQTRRETHGSRTREITIELGGKSHEFKATDVGGSDTYQDIFWKIEIAKADGIIYVIDASLINECQGTDHDLNNWEQDGTNCPNTNNENKVIKCGCSNNSKFVGSRMAKSFAFSILDTGKPILVFLNKYDLIENQHVYSIEDVLKLYNIDNNSKYNSLILTGSALHGDKVFEGIEWLFSQM